MKTGCDLVREWRAFPARCSQSELTRLSEMDCGCDAVDGGHGTLGHLCVSFPTFAHWRGWESTRDTGQDRAEHTSKSGFV